MKAHSHLTRRVFRALIANQPYISSHCLRRTVPQQILRPFPSVNYQQKRHFLEALLGDNKPARVLSGEKPTAKNLDVAVTKLVDLLQARRSQSRTPAHEELIDALKFLFSSRLAQKQPLTRNEIYLATETFKHLQERDLVLSDHTGCMKEDVLDTILHALALPEPDVIYRSDTRALADLVVQSLTSTQSLSQDLEDAYTRILATTGSATEAIERLSAQSTPNHDLMIDSLIGLIEEAKRPQFWSQLNEWNQEHGILDAAAHERLVVAFIRTDKVFDARRLYDLPISGNGKPTLKCSRRMLEVAIRTGKTELARELVESLSENVRSAGVVQVLLLHYAANNPDLSDLTDVVNNLLHASRAIVDITTFNDLSTYALTQNNPSLAAAVLLMAANEGYYPNGKTHAIQLAQAIDARELDDAWEYFQRMLNEEHPEDNYDTKILNRYLEALSFNTSSSYEQVMRVADRILERGADFDVGAIGGLCHVFLKRSEFDEAVGLLRYRTDFLPPTDRARISAVFQDFILTSKIKDQQAFNAYELFRVAFPETSVADRLPIMQAFFDRKRPDLACLVFSHMRQATAYESARPDADAYTKCFEGIAQCRDVDGLQSIYNMLKLDLQVDINTKIRNALMLANIACQTPWQAIIDHFYKIMDSREGPSYSTFEVALRACETWPPYGSFEARKIIAIMQSWNLEITKPLYDNYVGVLAGQCEFENAVELVENMYKDMGERPDAFTIGTFYNAIPWQYRKDEVEKWARQAYPDLWEELESFGDEIDEEWEVRYFKLDRSIDIDDPPLFAAGEWKYELQREVQAQIEPLPMST